MLNMLNINGQNHKKTKNATRMWAKVMAALEIQVALFVENDEKRKFRNSILSVADVCRSSAIQ